MPESTPSPSDVRWVAKQFTEGVERFCDLVMKGGVTSGVVYPLAVCRLAEKYAFKKIGGTSVGAIAAVLTAAAEYRRRHGGAEAGAGYVNLAKLPDFLKVPGALRTLFTADPSSKKYLAIALDFVGTDALRVKFANGVVTSLKLFGWPFVFTAGVLIVESLLAFGHGLPLPVSWWIASAASLALAAAASAAATVALIVKGCLGALSPKHDFGWCHGHDEDAFAAASVAASRSGWLALRSEQTPPLTSWLHGVIQETAGRTVADPPLTIGDLQDSPDPALGYSRDVPEGLDLRVVTTCVTLGRPFAIPFDDGDGIAGLCFKPCEFRKFFPSSVVDDLIPEKNEAEFVPFPRSADIPLVVAARLSMSFPVLFCAVPLWAPDAKGKMRKIWFSDGGLTSNFPIHFFDAPLPSWPTFAIDLVGGNPKNKRSAYWLKSPQTDDDPGAVFMEDEQESGGANTIDPWDRFDGLAAFLMAIVDTMRTWQDSTLRTLPANRSRTVGIRLSDNEGGLNLNMPPQIVADLTGRGDLAGRKLVSRFSAEHGGWLRHGWIRYRTAAAELSGWLASFHQVYGNRMPPRLDYPATILDSYEGSTGPNAAPSYLWRSAPVADRNGAATQRLDDLAASWDPSASEAPDFVDGQPIPKASLRTRPPF